MILFIQKILFNNSKVIINIFMPFKNNIHEFLKLNLKNNEAIFKIVCVMYNIRHEDWNAILASENIFFNRGLCLRGSTFAAIRTATVQYGMNYELQPTPAPGTELPSHIDKT